MFILHRKGWWYYLLPLPILQPISSRPPCSIRSRLSRNSLMEGRETNRLGTPSPRLHAKKLTSCRRPASKLKAGCRSESHRDTTFGRRHPCSSARDGESPPLRPEALQSHADPSALQAVRNGGTHVSISTLHSSNRALVRARLISRPFRT